MAANRPQAPPQTHGNMSSSSAPGPVAQKLPTPPHIPTNALQALIPRLTTTINEIDTFNAILAQGQIDGSLPSWDQILQRYATLLGRFNSISSYLSLPPPAPPLRPGAPPPGPDASRPALERIIVHPLNPLPDAPVSGSAPGPGGIEGAKGTAVNGSNGPGAGANGDTPGTAPAAAQTELHPIAPEAFYQVINTQPLPSLISAQSESVARASVRGGWGFNNSNVDGGDDKSSGHITLDEPTLRRLLAGHDVPSIPESRGGNGPAIVQALRERLAERLKREEGAAKRLREVVQEKEEEYDWGMRIDEEGADDGAQGGEAKGEAAGDEDEDDLFGDDGEVQIIPPPAAATASTGTAGAKAPAASAQGPGEGAGTIGAGAAAAPPNPRAGWSTADYIKYMDTGRIPPSAQS